MDERQVAVLIFSAFLGGRLSVLVWPNGSWLPVSVGIMVLGLFLALTQEKPR